MRDPAPRHGNVRPPSCVKPNAASSAFTSASVRASIVPGVAGERAVVSSWKTTTTPSLVRRTSVSIASAPSVRGAVEGGERVLRREAAPAAVGDEPGGGEVERIGRAIAPGTASARLHHPSGRAACPRRARVERGAPTGERRRRSPGAPPRNLHRAPQGAPPPHARGRPQRRQPAQAQAGEPPRRAARARRSTTCSARFGDPVVVDCGAGKSYLGFVLYELFLGPAGKGTLLAVESRPDLARGGRGARGAARLRAAPVRRRRPSRRAPVPERVHLVTALHACDTATDDALALAIRHGADHVAVVPCCQAEVARQLADAKTVARCSRRSSSTRGTAASSGRTSRTWCARSRSRRRLQGDRHRAHRLGALREERAHPRARRCGPARARRGERLDALLAATGVRPKLVRLLAGEAA